MNSAERSKSKSKLCYDRRSAGQSVLEQSTHLGLTTRSWLLSDICGFVNVGRSTCRLQLLLDLARAVFLGSESLETRDHILLSQFWDFPFRRLLRLAGSRWRYSTPPHTGMAERSHVSSLFITAREPHRDHRGQGLHYCSSWMRCLGNRVLTPKQLFGL
jgi:hypothetical protein